MNESIQSIDIETVKWIVGGMLGIIGILVSILWGFFMGDIKKARAYRHHVAPALFAEVHNEILGVKSTTDNHEWRISAHDDRLNKLERK